MNIPKLSWLVGAALAYGTACYPQHVYADTFCGGAGVTSGKTWNIIYGSEAPVQLGKLHARMLVVKPAEGNEHFLCPERVEAVTAMPGHEHGMQTQVRITPLEGCRFLIEGNLWHMPGEWRQEAHFYLGARVENFVIGKSLDHRGCER